MDSQAIYRSLDFRSLINVLWRRKWIIILSVILITSISVSTALFLVTEKYESTAELLYRETGIDKILLGSDLFNSNFQPERNILTAAELVRAPAVSSAVEEELGDRLGGQDAASMIKTSAAKKADIINITATNTDPELAAAVANSFAAQYISWRKQVDLEVLEQARIPIEAQLASIPSTQQNSANYQVLREKLETIKLLESMQTGNLEIFKPAVVSDSPVSPKPVRTGIVAFLISLATGMGLVLLAEKLDTTVHETDDVSRLIDKPILAAIPWSSVNNSRIVTLRNPFGNFSESYRMLRTNLSFVNPDNDLKKLLVTSVGPKEGKSSTIANLAVTLARTGKRVIVIEADLRKPKLAEYFQLSNAVGVTNVIAGDTSLREALQMIEARELVVEREQGNGSNEAEETPGGFRPITDSDIKPIYLATSGPIPPNPGEIASSEKLSAIIEEAGSYADFVLIDAPPVGVVGDAASLAANVDGVLFVVRLDKTPKKEFEILNRFIDSVPSPVLGVVVTGTKSSGKYSYSGSYYYQ